MENEQLFEEMIELLGQIVTAAGPEWTLQFLEAGMEEAQAGGGELEQPMPQMPSPRRPGNAFAQ